MFEQERKDAMTIPDATIAKIHPKADLKFERKGGYTRVFLDGEFIGLIQRREVSNASPRGGAYRTEHFAIPGTKHRSHGVGCYTRKEATEWLVGHHAGAAK